MGITATVLYAPEVLNPDGTVWRPEYVPEKDPKCTPLGRTELVWVGEGHPLEGRGLLKSDGSVRPGLARLPVYSRHSYVGAVLEDREENGRDDSDFYAVVWDEEAQECRRIDYSTTRFAGGGQCVVDATDEVRAKAVAWSKRVLRAKLEAADVADAATTKVGKVVRVLRGKHAGKVGEVLREWVRRSAHGTWVTQDRVHIGLLGSSLKQRFTVFPEEDTVYYQAPYNEDFPRLARQAGGNWIAARRAWAFPVALEERARALFARSFPPTSDDSVWVDRANTEVVDVDAYRTDPAELSARAEQLGANIVGHFTRYHAF